MAEKICAVCQTENQAHFTYCKYCGAMLPVVEKIKEEPPKTPENKRSFGEISYFEYHRYIGSGAEGILADFERLETGNRFVFCLPALFLGFFFGFYGLSSWFFYRNLKKYGLILLGLGIFFSLVDALVNFSVNRMFITELFNILSPRADIALVLSSVAQLINYYLYSFISVSNPVGFFASIIAAAVCLKIYKKDSERKISNLKAFYNEQSSLPLDILLKKEGGTSLALSTVPFVFYFVLPILFLAVSAI